ncbi:glutathione S-transferase family protein [Hirschia litorea]|uniref:Glutathione S-transferase family protein n=1 Tax=Hirschia litorea TaxID=1199156 RepID=A0ABW2IQ75_9PROT
MALKLYSFPLSGHAHRAELFISLIGAEVEIINLDLANGAHKTPEFLAKNTFGQVPVLEDGDIYISDSNAILVYLAKKLGKIDWLPEDALGAANVQRWLSVAQGHIAFGPAAARLITLFNATMDPEEVIARAHAILSLIDAELADKPFITGSNVTLADVSLYSYIFSAPEGNVDLTSYTHINAWLGKIEALPGFKPFPQTSVGLRKLT